MKRLSALIILGFFFVLVQPHAVFAQTNNGALTVSPAYIEVTLTKPEEEQDISISYTNSSTQPITLEMFPLDFAHKDANGTIGLIAPQQGSYTYGLASYLSLQSDRVTIEPKESHIFHVKIKNRLDLSPGGHYGAIIGRIVSPPGSANRAQVAPSVSSLIFLNKSGGERYNLSLRSFDWGGAFAFSYPHAALLQFQNEGNIHLVPYGRIEVKDMLGRLTYQGILNTSSFMVLPESRRYMTVKMQQLTWTLPVSVNTITVRGNDSLKKTTFLFQTTSISISPWFLGSFICLVLLAVFLLKKRKSTINTEVVQKYDKSASIRAKKSRKI